MNYVPVTIRRRDLAAVQRRATRTARALPLKHDPRRVRLWLPLTPLFWVLSPFALLAAPLITLAPPLRGMNPYAAAVALGHVLVSLGGTEVDVDARAARLRIRIL